MSDEDKRNFEIWTEQNCESRSKAELRAVEHFWDDGAIESDLIVIDDPQCERHI